MFSSIVRLGGPGDVGRRVINLLNEHTDCRIYLVSRKGGTDTDRVRHLKMDLGANEAEDRLPKEAAVVNLTETTSPALAAAVVRRGGLFLDTSPSPEYVSALEPKSRPGSVMGRLAGRQCEMVFLMMRSQCHHADKPEPRELLQV